MREALENLEVQYLANREAHLHFALLSDFTDAPLETLGRRCRDRRGRRGRGPRAQRAVCDGADDAFYLFHRPRRWNPRQGVWMGWERKRGQAGGVQPLSARRSGGGVLDRSSATPTRIRQVRYVITLDADTVLPPDAAPLLVGAIAHPLNRAEYDPAAGRVVHGYGILQPRVGVSLPGAHRSRFAADSFRAPGGGSLHHRRVRRLPGPVRRGELHRQGHLRRRLRSSRRRTAAFPRTRSSRTTSSREATPGPGSPPTSSSTTTTRPAISPTRGGSTAGSAATGSCSTG